MADLDAVLQSNRAAVDELINTGEQAAGNWTTPRAPGKWSPQQVVEHVARTYDEGAKTVKGVPNEFPTLPGFIKPIFRVLFFNRILKKNRFMNARTFKAFDPETGPTDPAAGKVRLEEAVSRFNDECRACGETGSVMSGAFGRVGLADYIKFQELHTRHHRKQIPVN